jgi:hypothetical protein
MRLCLMPTELQPLNTLSWYWIGVAVLVPPVFALLAALPFWWTRQMTFGSIVGTAVIFGSAIALILREYVEMDRTVRQCLDAGFVCWPEPSAFTRCAIFAFIGLIQVFGLFSLGLVVDERVRRRAYAPEWR